MNHRPFSLLLCAILMALAAPWSAHAEKADRNKPMQIEADALRHDELKQTSVFSGRVVVTKGTIVLRGTQLDVRQDAQGFQHGVMQAAAGQRAFFRQKRDTAAGAPEEFIEGEGELIEYDGRTDVVRFVRRAELRRYRGGALADEIHGALIVYDNLTDMFTVDGQKTAPAGTPSGTPGGRVRATLVPKEADAPAPAGGTPPALRVSPQLDSARP